MESDKLFKLKFADFQKKIGLMEKSELQSKLCFAYGWIKENKKQNM